MANQAADVAACKGASKNLYNQILAQQNAAMKEALVSELVSAYADIGVTITENNIQGIATTTSTGTGTNYDGNTFPTLVTDMTASVSAGADSIMARAHSEILLETEIVAARASDFNRLGRVKSTALHCSMGPYSNTIEITNMATQGPIATTWGADLEASLDLP